jgi:hypothetical protein
VAAFVTLLPSGSPGTIATGGGAGAPLSAGPASTTVLSTGTDASAPELDGAVSAGVVLVAGGGLHATAHVERATRRSVRDTRAITLAIARVYTIYARGRTTCSAASCTCR